MQGSSRSKRRFFPLSRCYFLRQFNVQGEDRRRLVPQKFLSPRELCPVLSSRPSPMSVYWLATSVFHFPLAIPFGTCQGKLYCFRDICKTQTIKFPRGKLRRENRSHLKNQVSLGKLSTSRVYLRKKSVV